ncbi:MAG: SpoIIE family protein phosphatase [Candidatus Ozemobacteraceae bacterium]
MNSKKWLFFIGIILALGTGSMGAWSLSRGLLKPIEAIEKGIDALKTHDQTFRILETRNDEFGALSQAFNHLLETTGELDAAKMVQESLVPTKLPSLPGYSLEMRFFRSKAIGGDYVDALFTSSGLFAFLVGDVAGHGVGSALIMAMAKSVVFLHFSEGGTPQDLLPRLNMALCNVSNQKNMMTFSFGILDPKTHEGRIFSGGNPYPLLWKAQEKVGTFIGAPRYPLGLNQGNSYDEGISFHFHPGDLLFLYTDGLVEAPDRENQPFGYEMLRQSVQELAPDGPVALCETFQKRIFQRVQCSTLSDDISYLAIQRDRMGMNKE